MDFGENCTVTFQNISRNLDFSFVLEFITHRITAMEENNKTASQANNTRIAKNAAALYLRMFITMLVGLYTSRVILQALGVEDYGIYNVVGGFVSMFSLISGSLQGSVSRFLTFALGKCEKDKLKEIFSTSCYVMIGLSLFVVIATESIGLWYLHNKMVIPIERMDAAFWVFQFSVISFVFNIINAPYSSSIISHERMDIYAYMSILDVTFKLLICYAVMVSPYDRLVCYAFLMLAVGVLNQVIYVLFCRRKFEECRMTLVFNRTLFKQMFGYAGWNFIGSSAAVFRTQGASLLLNAFGGPVVNAANGVANSISGIVQMFVSNFTQAFNPQITKRYAAGEYDSLMRLLVYGSKYSYYLMFIMALPVLFNARFILQLWLGVVPEYSVEFTRWILLFLLSESISRPIITAKNATGRIRNYQLVVGGVLLLMLPISYVGLRCGLSVVFVAFTNALTSFMAFFVRMYMLRGDFPSWSSHLFFKKVFLNVLGVSLLSAILPMASYFYLSAGWTNFLVTSLLSVASSLIVIVCLGCDKTERTFLFDSIKKIKQKILHRS